MNILLDQGLPRSTIRHLASENLAAIHVGEIGMAAATDEEILDEARRRQAVVVTLDADFHQLLALRGDSSPSVVRIRIERLKGEQIAAILIRVIEIAGEELKAGAVVSVTESQVRVRLLPLGVVRKNNVS